MGGGLGGGVVAESSAEVWCVHAELVGDEHGGGVVACAVVAFELRSDVGLAIEGFGAARGGEEECDGGGEGEGCDGEGLPGGASRGWAFVGSSGVRHGVRETIQPRR